MNNPIRRLRTERHLTRDELAQLVGVTGMTVYRWERGQHLPTAHVRNRLARRLGINQAQLERELGLTED